MRNLLPLLLCVPLAACEFESEGGDTDGGISACNATKGQGTWTSPTGSATASSSAALATLSVPAGLSTNFTSDGGTLKLTVHPLDADGNLLYTGLQASNFTLGDALTIGKMGSLTTSTISATGTIGELETGEAKGEGRSVVLLFDSSGSNGSTDPDRMRVSAGKEFVKRMSSGTTFAVMDFGVNDDWFSNVVSSCFDKSRFLLDFTTDKAAVQAAIDRVTASGGTPLYGALGDAVELVEGISKQGATNADVVLFTDGQAGDYSADTSRSIISRAKAVHARLHSIALSSEKADAVDIRHLQHLSNETGGVSVTVAEASDLLDEFGQVADVTNSELDINLQVQIQPATPLAAGIYTVRGSLSATINDATATAPFAVNVEVADGK